MFFEVLAPQVIAILAPRISWKIFGGRAKHGCRRRQTPWPGLFEVSLSSSNEKFKDDTFTGIHIGKTTNSLFCEVCRTLEQKVLKQACWCCSSLDLEVSIRNEKRKVAEAPSPFHVLGRRIAGHADQHPLNWQRHDLVLLHIVFIFGPKGLYFF